MRSLLRRLHRDDDGSVTLVTGVALAALVGATALAVDIGRITLADRETQSTADIAALDAVRALGDRRDPSRDVTEHATALTTQAHARNHGFLELADATPALTTAVGRFDPTSRTFTATTSDPNAVAVTAAASLPHAVVAGTTDVAGAAIAMIEEVGGVAVGSTFAAAEIDTTEAAVLDAVLGGLLGTPVSLGVVGYQGLAAADVALGELAGELGAGTTEELADTTVTVGQLASVAATALSRSAEASDAGAVTPLGDLGASAGTASVRIGDLLSLGPDDGALALEVDVLPFLLGAAAVANGGNAVTVSLPVTIPGAASVTATVAGVEPPRSAFGPPVQRADGTWEATARTAQVRAMVELVLPGAIEIPLPLTSVTADLTVSTYVELARGTAEVRGVTCPDIHGAGVLQVHGRTSGAGAWVGRVDPASLATSPAVSPVTLVDVAGIARVTGSGAVTVPGGEAPLTFATPTDEPQRVAGGVPTIGPALADGLSVRVEALTADVDTAALLAEVTAETDAVLRQLDQAVLDDLAAALGVSVADADVWALGVDCSGRRLVR